MKKTEFIKDVQARIDQYCEDVDKVVRKAANDKAELQMKLDVDLIEAVKYWDKEDLLEFMGEGPDAAIEVAVLDAYGKCHDDEKESIDQTIMAVMGHSIVDMMCELMFDKSGSSEE